MHFDFAALLVILTALSGLIWVLDALFFAGRRRARNQEEEPRAVEYARSFFPVLLIVLVIRSFIFEPFRIPSDSMMPTLLAGDFILVNKFAYGLRWPVLDKKFVGIGEPKRGDVVVFRYPKDTTTDYIKRIVGLPGDVISYHNETLFVNGQVQEKVDLGKFDGEGCGGRDMLARPELLREDLTGHEHQILLCPTRGRLEADQVVIPNGHYFAMGDNRDNSNDSRAWGLVPEENLVGKAVVIWMNWDPNHRWLPIGWSRIGDVIK